MGILSVHEILPQLYIAIMTQVFNLLLWIVLEQKGMRLFRSKRPYYNVVMAVFFANLLSGSATFLRFSNVKAPALFVTVLQALVYISNTVVTYAFTVFFIHYICAKKGQTGKSPLFNRVLLAVLMFTVAGWFVWALPQVRKTGEFLAIEGILLVFVAWIVVLYYMIFCIAYLVVNRKLLMRRERYVIVAGLVLTIAFTVAQAFAGEVLQINFVGTTLGLYLFYFYFYPEVAAPQAYAERSEAQAAQAIEPVAIKKERVRKRSVSGTVFALISVLMLVSYVLLGSYLYYRSRTLFLRELQTNALHSAESSAALVDALAHSRLKEGSEGSADYKTVQETLAVFREAFDLEYVYTVITNEDGIPVVCVDSDEEASDTFAYIGDEFAYSDATLSALAGTAAVDDEPLTDEWGVHLSAYAPVFLYGKVICATGVDVDYGWVNRELRQIVRATVFACAICLFVSLLLLLALSRYLKNRFRLLNEKIDVLSYDSEGLKRIDGLNSGDEFEMIADHINEVFEKNMAAQQIEADKLRSAMEVVEQKAEEKLALAEEKLEVAEGRLAQAAYLEGEGTPHPEMPPHPSGTPHPSAAPTPSPQREGLERPQEEGLLPELDAGVTKEEAIRRVREAAPEILKSYRALSGLLQPYFEPEGTREAEEDLPEIDPEELEELYGAILEFAEMYDEDAIRRLLEQTNGYTVPESERERFARVKECVAASDWGALKEALTG